jgi:hypothetical protein
MTLALSVALALGVAGCADLVREPAVPAAGTKQSTVLGIENARYVIDDSAPVALAAEFRRAYEREVRFLNRTGRALPASEYLAISGGGDNGAFGAGLLVGWTKRGTRPLFKAVTGVSTGALIAPFAFLGSSYDQSLTEVYTTIDQKDIFVRRPMLAAVTADSMADTRPLYELISRYVDDQLVERIAAEYDKGRLLFIASTNLDAGRSVIWNIGAIARSGKPGARDLIRKVLLASAAIPGLFPPVAFDVTYDGATYQELHADGGAMTQMFLYPPTIDVGRLAIPARKRTAYVIRNGKLAEDWKETDRKTLAIAGRAISTLITSSGVNDMYRIYATTRRDGVGFNLAYIEDDFNEPDVGEFDRNYMNKLFDYAMAKAAAGYPWRKGPPGFRS